MTQRYLSSTAFRARAPRSISGFTLIEVLTAMMVLAIGLAGAMSLVYGSSRAAQTASDHNAAAIVLQEAIEDIKRIHMITPTMPGVSPALIGQDEIGLYVETLPTGDGKYPNCKTGDYAGTQTSADGAFVTLSANRPALFQNELAWPFTASSPKFYGLGKGAIPGGGVPGFRVIYRLERHPDWVAGTSLSYEGIYVLTATVYKDLNPNVLPLTAGTKKFEQISDPMVVYLRSGVAE